MKKYELIPSYLHGLHRIKALIDIPRHNVKIGDIGGYVSYEHNLSHEGDCWVSDNDNISHNAKV